jgi:hypothetical protein
VTWWPGCWRFVRAGYLHEVPETDYIPLLALLWRRSSDDEVTVVANVPTDHKRARCYPTAALGTIGSMSATTRKTTAPRASTRVAADDPLSASRVRYLVDIVGGAQLAAFVGVNRSQPSRWMKGEERPGPTAAPLLIDLEHVLARARLVWGDIAATTWLASANSYLDGARPIDVLQISGPAPVLQALDAETWGGAA